MDPTRKTVLVADDDPMIVDVAKEAIEQGLGVRVITAGDGEEALRLIQEEKPSVAVLDLMLPKALGWGVVRQARADAATRGMPIIALSATGDRWGAMDAGCDDYLNKPFLIDQLVGLVRRWLVTERPA